MVDWRYGTWNDGDSVEFYASRPKRFLSIKPGLYWYSGFGSGTLFRPGGTMFLNCSPIEAAQECDMLGIEFRYVDSFGK